MAVTFDPIHLPARETASGGNDRRLDRGFEQRSGLPDAAKSRTDIRSDRLPRI
jgi:hypothetical protein